METRHRAAILSAVFLVVGASALMPGLVAWLALRLFPSIEARPLGMVEILVGLPLLVASVLLGALLGSTVWYFVMRRWLNVQELRWFFVQPYVPLITPILAWLFRTLQPGDEPDGDDWTP